MNQLQDAVIMKQMHHPRNERHMTKIYIQKCSLPLRTAFFWAIKQRLVVIPYRPFWTPYRLQLKTLVAWIGNTLPTFLETL